MNYELYFVPLHAKNYNNDEKFQQNKHSPCDTVLPVGICALYIIIDNINNPQTITVNGPDRTYVETIHVPQQITGYEYQFLACRQALLDGQTELREMPHAEILYIMQLMDDLRRKWGVRYPMDEE